MPQAEPLPAPLDSDRMFLGLFLAAYGLLLVDLLLSQQARVAQLARGLRGVPAL